MKRTLFFLLFVTSLTAQTKDDLYALVGVWNSLATPGNLIETKAQATIYVDKMDIVTVMDAAKIGDDKDTMQELVSKKQAFSLKPGVGLRVLEPPFHVSCLILIARAERCSYKAANLDHFIPGELDRVFNDLTPDSETSQAFKKRDISFAVKEAYVQVRIVDGPFAGEKGFLSMLEVGPKVAQVSTK
jgi:hypothetical protein